MSCILMYYDIYPSCPGVGGLRYIRMLQDTSGYAHDTLMIDPAPPTFDRPPGASPCVGVSIRQEQTVRGGSEVEGCFTPTTTTHNTLKSLNPTSVWSQVLLELVIQRGVSIWR